MSDPSRLAVTPASIADVGRQLAALQTALDRTRAHLAGPRPAPEVGDVACALAYQTAAHQLAGLVTTAAEQQAALTRSMTAAAAMYAILDGASAQGTR